MISRGPTKSNKTDTCNALLEQFDKEKLAIQEHLDNMDVMLFKPREELLKDEVKAELVRLAPKFGQFDITTLELAAMVKTKTKAAKASK